MSNEEAISNIVGLMTSFHLEIKALSDKLKCVKCKSVLKNAYQLSCGCRFCRTCIDDVISRGYQFCPGDSQQCGATSLSKAVPDYRANNNILKLTVKCPHAGCPHECPLTDIERHMCVCSRKNIGCPFRKLGCEQGALPGEEMIGHLLQESLNHSEILIGMVTNISRDMEMLKRELLLKDEQGIHLENEMKLIKDENKAINDVIIKIDIKSIKDEVKIKNKSIKREKEVLCERVRQLSEKLKREIGERRQSDERDSTMVIAVTKAVASNRNEMNLVSDDIRSIRDQSDYMECHMESIQEAVGLEQLGDWLIEENVAKTDWRSAKTSGKFGGVTLHYAFELASYNSVSWGQLGIYLRIWADPRDPLLQWPFRGALTVIVAHRDSRDAFIRQTRQYRIEKPSDDRYSTTAPFQFRHVALRGAGLDLERGVRVSCQIVPVTPSPPV